MHLDFVICTCLKIFTFDLLVDQVTFKAHGTGRGSWAEVGAEDEMQAGMDLGGRTRALMGQCQGALCWLHDNCQGIVQNAYSQDFPRGEPGKSLKSSLGRDMA